MGQFLPSPINVPLEEQLKALEVDELLDIWEESHQLDRLLSEENKPTAPSLEYERLIIQELQLRSCRRQPGSHP